MPRDSIPPKDWANFVQRLFLPVKAPMLHTKMRRLGEREVREVATAYRKLREIHKRDPATSEALQVYYLNYIRPAIRRIGISDINGL